MSKLYEISERFKALQAVSDGDEIPREALEDTFEAIEGEFNDKAAALVSVVNNMDSDVSELDKEIKRLQLRKKAVQNKQNSMREYLRDNMLRSGIKNIKCPLFSISCSDSTDVVVITDEDAIPDEYIDVSVVSKVNKTAIKRALKDGDDVAGARLEKGTAKLTIR